MPDLTHELKEKKRMLKELKAARTKATCASVVSTEVDVRRELEVEELESEIEKLEKRLKAKPKA